MRNAVLIASLLLGSIEWSQASGAPLAAAPLVSRSHEQDIVKILVYLDEIVARAKAMRVLAGDADRHGSSIRSSCLGAVLAEANAAVDTAHQLSDSWQRALRNEQFGLRTMTRLQELARMSDLNAARGRACLDRNELARSLSASSTTAVQMDVSALVETAVDFSIERMGVLRRPPIASPY